MKPALLKHQFAKANEFLLALHQNRSSENVKHYPGRKEPYKRRYKNHKVIEMGLVKLSQSNLEHNRSF